jgi:hypothetical protein
MANEPDRLDEALERLVLSLEKMFAKQAEVLHLLAGRVEAFGRRLGQLEADSRRRPRGGVQ